MKKLQGVIINDKMVNTVVVEVERWVIHPMYGKRVRRHKKYHAENLAGAKSGNKVIMMESKPLSKTKRWKILEVVE